MEKKKIIIITIILILLIITGIIFGIITLNNKNKVVYIADNEFLYDIAIDYLKSKYSQEEIDYNQKEDYQIFFDYKGFGISQDNNKKYAYMWILKESYYVENGKLQIGSGSSMPYKITFEDNKVINIETSKDGTYYASSIRDMFPDDIENQIIEYHLDSDNLKKKVNEHYSYINSSDYTPTLTEYEFIAEIIEAHDNYIMIRPDANSRERKSGDRISVGIIRPTDESNDFYVVGNKIKIIYDGTIMETYPAQIYAIKIELVSEINENNPVQNNPIENKWDASKVNIKIKDGTVTNESTTIIITDKNVNPISWTVDFLVEVKNGESWEPAPQLAEVNWISTLITPDENGITEMNCNWKVLYNKLESGTYRIVKNSYSQQYDKVYSEPFIID